MQLTRIRVFVRMEDDGLMGGRVAWIPAASYVRVPTAGELGYDAFWRISDVKYGARNAAE